MKGVIQQSSVAAYRDPLSCRAQIRFRCDGVLEVAQFVGAIRYRLRERHPQVGRISLAPPGYQGRQPIEHQPPETSVIPGQIVDSGLDGFLRRTDGPRLAIE